MDIIINGGLFLVAVVMLWKMMQMNKRNKKAKEIIDIVNSVDDKELFLAKADKMIQGNDGIPQ